MGIIYLRNSMSIIFVKFNKALGEIPEGALGLLRSGIMGGDVNRSRVFIPRHYVGISKSLIPCYDLRGASDYVEVPESVLTEQEKQELVDLDAEISNKTNLMIGPGGMIVTILGNVAALRKALDSLGEREEWNRESSI